MIQKKRISSVNQNRNLKTGKNKNFSTTNKFHSSNKVEKNNLKNNFTLRKEIKNSLSKTYKMNNNKNDVPVSLSNNHLNKNINIKIIIILILLKIIPLIKTQKIIIILNQRI